MLIDCYLISMRQSQISVKSDHVLFSTMSHFMQKKIFKKMFRAYSRQCPTSGKNTGIYNNKRTISGFLLLDRLNTICEYIKSLEELSTPLVNPTTDVGITEGYMLAEVYVL